MSYQICNSHSEAVQKISVKNTIRNYTVELIKYCKRKKITLVLTALPNYYRLTEVIKNEKVVFEFYSKLEEIPEVYYLNLVNSEIAYNEENFYNFTHLNLNVANKLSKKLSNELDALLRIKK